MGDILTVVKHNKIILMKKSGNSRQKGEEAKGNEAKNNYCGFLINFFHKNPKKYKIPAAQKTAETNVLTRTSMVPR